jgi:hypothetical protein
MARAGAKAVALPRPSTISGFDDVGDLRRDPKSRVLVSAGGRDRGPKAAKAQRSTERVDIQYGEEKTRATVTRVVDTLGGMHAKGSISDQLYEAGLRFQDDFDRSHWESMPSMRLDGMPPGGRVSSDPHRPIEVIDARSAGDRAMRALGGPGSPCGIAVWWILGMRWSIRQVAQREPVSRIEVWTGTLIGALGVLESHYQDVGYRRRGRSAP